MPGQAPVRHAARRRMPSSIVADRDRCALRDSRDAVVHPVREPGAPPRFSFRDRRSRSRRRRRPRCESRWPPVRPICSRRHAGRTRRCEHGLETDPARHSRRRARPTRRRASPPASRRRRPTRPRGIATLAPSPPASKQHSASVTANPPSAQSCADRIRPSLRQIDQQLLQRAFARRDRAPAACRAAARARSSDTRCRRARRGCRRAARSSWPGGPEDARQHARRVVDAARRRR